ncbi:hypothetical protein A5747_13450 [Mycobacterium sp. IS-836]|uniref:hypothetical protein n=1 Tax=Mycobacterium sp. IS-836 TaxID=1834160 RepID=UPI00096E53DA|nr:hypothetical protein [Mycobacterium sp. IS-836]OMC55393.1 hypothetical protein A5747_13450 [Mycobacterium sp. IS-836]
MTVDLKAIRTTAGLTPTEMAAQLGLSPRSGRITVSLMEGRDDWLLSSLSAYFKACGAVAELVVTVEGDEFRFTVA